MPQLLLQPITRADQTDTGCQGAWRRQHGADLAQREQRAEDLTQHRDAQRDRVIDRATEHPPRYLIRALGDRPTEARQRAAWDTAVREVETYRAKFGVRDQHTALGRQPDYGTQRDHFNRATGHARDTHAIAHHRPGAERGFGRGIGGRGR